MNGVTRLAWQLQWPATIATPIWFVTTAYAAGTGWNLIFLMVAAIPATLLLLVGAIVSVAARGIRRAKRMPPVFSVLIWIAWIAGAIWPLTIQEDSDGAGQIGSILGRNGSADGAGVVALSAVSFVVLCVSISLAVIALVAELIVMAHRRRAPTPVRDGAKPLPVRAS
ncbi:MAG: hypothetical protein ABIS08_03480 [Pseudolysinimonas sp.]